MDYVNFELEIGPGAGRDYPIAVRSPGGEARETLHFPYGKLELQNKLLTLQNALLRSGGRRRQALSPEQQSVQDFGKALFNALLPGEVRVRYDVSLRDAAAQGKGLRLKLRFTTPELATLPWEYLYDPRRAEYVCLSQDTPLVRYLELPRPRQPLAITPPLRILGMVASPRDLGALDVALEQQRVEESLADLQAEGLVELMWLAGDTWRDLQRALRAQGPWHIFHFIGHGDFDAAADEGLLMFCNADGKAERMHASRLGRLLANHRSLRLALLNACDGAVGSTNDLFSSTASLLVRRGLPAVLAMQYAITDKAAIEFARTFYESLADGLPVDAAVVEARVAVSLAVHNTVEWGTPVLFMRAPDGALFRVQEAGDRIQDSGFREQETRVSGEGPSQVAPSQRDPKDVKETPHPGKQQPVSSNQKPASSFQQPASIPGELYQQMHAALLRCDAFGSDQTLQALFVDSRISTWRNDVPQARSKAERVSTVIAWLSDKTNDSNENGLVLFLHVLRERVSTGDALHNTLGDLAGNLEQVFEPTARGGQRAVSPLAALLQDRQPFEPEMIIIPAGEFLMGSDPQKDKGAYDDEQPQHPLYLPDYAIAKAPITNVQYAAFVQTIGYTAPEHWNGEEPPQDKLHHPVVNVSWDDAMRYCAFLREATGKAYTLPSEAEWEKAARGPALSGVEGTEGRLYPWGNKPPNAERCNFDGNVGTTTSVGKYSPQGDSPYGCVDMAGNVWEWTRSLFKPYPYDPTDGREDLNAEGSRVCRGGAFIHLGRCVRSACRLLGPRFNLYGYLGVRVVVGVAAPFSHPVQA